MLNYLRNIGFRLQRRNYSGFASVDAIRGRLKNIDYERATDVVELRRAQAVAIASNAIEDLHRTDEMIAFDELMIEMRVPAGPIRRQARDWLISFILSEA